ncbi:proline--tRNA ligase [candidate division WS5 bacterium]|uniref:Proline--tRNA ligase n=1 Tax=candidate division WS5 bacterium TaxID=2093353 RepID=A0A419DEH7_9BACT|nr:MAG: proline--tRNA ligase [candidate division WS5 bacterium]
MKAPEKITKQSENFSKWYTDVVKVADMVDYGPVKGTMIIKPYGYSIWENIQSIFDERIKRSGISNGYFPLFIPESFLKKEKDHVEGFSPELAVVTYAGGEKLTEKVVVRPTSETVMYDAFSRWISSYRDLPYHVNQWCNVVRWEKKTKPFIRTTEFLWQEGHSVLATEKETDALALGRLEEYRKFFEEILCIPVFVGKKSEKEKFAGALYSTSCEALLKDGKALQSATSHNLGQNFSRVFNIQFETENGKREYVWQSSWGMSTRVIGGVILTHGDDKGLALPPDIAPIQVVVVPIYKDEEEKKKVIDYVGEVTKTLKNFRIEVDNRDQYSPGWKFNEWEVKGVPLRIEIGPKEAKEKKITLVSRINSKRESISLSKFNPSQELSDFKEKLLENAKKFVKENTFEVRDYKEFKKLLTKKRGFLFTPWCEEGSCEQKIKDETTATTRVIPFEQKKIKGEKCVYCGKEAKVWVYFAKAY